MKELLTQAHRLHQAGNFAEAARLYEDALRSNRAQVDALFPLGILRFQAGKYGEAEQLIGEAIRINPQIAEAHFMLGCVLQRLNRIEDAFAAFSRAVANNPRYVEALANRGASLMALGRHAEALTDCDAVLSLNPSLAGAWSNRGCILQNLDRHEEAIACFDRALALNPSLTEALANKGAALSVLKRFAEAAATFEKLISVSPEHPYARGYLAFYRLQCCDWGRLAEDRAAIAGGLAAGKRVVQPFINVTLSRSPADQLQCARIFARDRPTSSAPLWRGETFVHDKMRLAYLSADFRTHATAVLMAGVFEHHDRSRFEVAAISTAVDDHSPMRSRLEAAFDRFIDVRHLDDRQAAVKIREMEIDIVVDLKGYTGDARPGILAHRPAPLQAHYLGYPGTMAADHIDYLIADKVVIPDGHRQFYTEKIVTLPYSYQCNDSNRQIAEHTPTRAAAGLPDRGFVFCCFNNVSKITPEIFDLWMRLLRDVDGSVLWLLEANNDAVRNLKREAERVRVV
jgi:predicted O-linked N-acetylglucosamine transferase (SPINDLY family)